MKIKVYGDLQSNTPIEEHEWGGALDAWFVAAKVDRRRPLHVEKDGDIVHLRVIPLGGIGKILGSVFGALFGFLLPSTNAGRRNDPGQGRQLNSAEAKANTAKLNRTVPELLGHFIRMPDYLVAPRRYFADPHTQYLDLFLCVGPGDYQIDPSTVKIGNTPVSTIPGAEFAIRGPGADVSSVEMAQNWYSAPEIGGTSAGTAGLDLTAAPDSNITPTGGSFVFSGATSITTSDGWPQSWGPGVQMGLVVQQSVTIGLRQVSGGEDPVFINTFTGNWQEIAPTLLQMLKATGGYEGDVRVYAVSGNTLELYAVTTEGETPINNLPEGTLQMALSVPGRTYVVDGITETQIDISAQGVSVWAGFPTGTVPAGLITWTIDPGTVYGETAGPYVILPKAELTQTLEVDFFFPQGLCALDDNAGVLSRSLGVVIEYRNAATGGVWTGVSRTYNMATLDQIGFTERITLPTPMRPEVRIRRRGARSTSSQVHDIVQWYGARCLLAAPASYPWTTISLRVRGLGQIAANSENQVSLEATRILPTLQSDGTWGTPVPTRDISAALWYVASTAGRGTAAVNISELLALHNLWVARGETFDAVLDEQTALDAMQDVLLAGMSELTLEEGAIRPVRAGIRTTPTRGYSAQNTVLGSGIRRAFTSRRPDENDGVEVEFQDASDGWATATVICVLPGSLGARLQKIKLDGVTDRNRAWRIGMRRAREQMYQRWSYDFTTEMDALCSSYGDYVYLVNDQSALLTNIVASGANVVMRVTEKLRWTPDKEHHVSLRRADGSVAGPWTATRGADDYEIIAPVPVGERPVISMKQELPHVYFGPTDAWRWPAIVKSIKPGDGYATKVTAVNYDARIYADDDNNAP